MKRQLLRHCNLIAAVVLLFAIISPAMAQTADDSAASVIPNAAETPVKQWDIGGYVKDLQYIQFQNLNGLWTLNNIIHNRIDAHWYASSEWQFTLGLRTRLIDGASAQVFEQNASLLNSANGIVPLGGIISQGQSYLLHSMFDRAFIEYTKDEWQVSLGRQRINWGLNLIWNPNDIFNAYSYFDFDYEERPGTDAVRVQYYTGSTSSVEIAYKPGGTLDSTIASALYRVTSGSFDIQALAGIIDSDYAIGGGWSGVLGGSSFSGEATAFIPRDNPGMKRSSVAASTEIYYTFSNSLMLNGSYLFNSEASLKPNGLLFNPQLEQVNAKMLSPSRHSLFVEASYQISPLTKGDMAGILNPMDGSFYIGPSITTSLTNEIDLLLGGELFYGAHNTLYGDYGKLLFVRLKWSF